MHEWQLADRRLHIGRRPLVMGVLNVTPDSFSDGGRHATHDAAIAQAFEMVRQGADLLDIGGESTRPGAVPVSEEAELARVLPVVSALASHLAIPLSIDTSKPTVAGACLAAGAAIINDVRALADPDMVNVVRSTGAGVILMHMQGTPATMQDNPVYVDVVADVGHFLEQRLHQLAQLGIAADRVVVDPGIGFGKTLAHNLEMLTRLRALQQLGRPVCLGVSRKGFIGRLLDRAVDDRLAGSLAVVCFALAQQAVQVVRVHDVAPTVDAVRVWEQLVDAAGVTADQ